MDETLLERAKRVVWMARQAGATGVRASIGSRRESTVQWRDGALERLFESTSMGLEVFLLVDGRCTINTTSDLRPQAVERFLENSIRATRLLSPDPHRRLPPADRLHPVFQGDLGLFDRSIKEATAPERRRIARELVEAARSAPGADRIVSAEARATDIWSQAALVSSNGTEGTAETTLAERFAQTHVRDADNRKPEGAWISVSRTRAGLATIESIGAEATRRALWNLGARPIKSGEYPCVLEAQLGGQILAGLLEALEGNQLQQGSSFLAQKLGQAVASPCLTVTDSPHVIGGLGSRRFDPEGMASRTFPLIERGNLRGFYLGTYDASKLGLEPTTVLPSNLVFEPGERDLAGLLGAMGSGVLITDLPGGNSNPATGDFSLALRGHWVEGGTVVHPVAEMNLAGNHATFWHKLAELGNDPTPASRVRSPALRFGSATFSGT